MNKIELEECLRLHLLYLKNDECGKRADLSGANLSRANLSRANLSGANLSGANLSGANLSGANLSGANLSGANLSGANLSGANLSGANLSGAYLSGADLRNTILEGKSILSFQFQRHTGYYCGLNFIRIGCHELPVSEWLEKYQEIGQREHYTESEIQAYGNFIKYCASLEKK